jgi:transposase
MVGPPAVAGRRAGAINRHVRELDRLAEDLAVLDREIAEAALEDPDVKRLMTITGVNLTVATGILTAIGDIGRFDSPGKLVTYFGLNPRVRQSGHAFFVRIRAKRGHQIAAVAVARKLTVLCLTRSQNLAPSVFSIQTPRISFVPSAWTPSAM